MTCRCGELATSRSDFSSDTEFGQMFDCFPTVDGGWEAVYRCRLCGRNWFMSDWSGHAIIKRFEPISRDEAEQLIGRVAAETAHAATQPQIELIIPDGNAEPESDSPKWLQWMVGGMIGAATLAAFAAMSMTPGAVQDQLILSGGILFVSGIGLAGLGAMRGW
jgi:hypothetical protein